MRTLALRLAAIVISAAVLGCGRDDAPTGLAAAPGYEVAATPMAFTIGPLTLSGIDVSFPGPNRHFRDVALSGPVAGDLVGQATMLLNANLDGSGNGPAFGTVSITTGGGDVWQGSFSGHFVGDLPAGIQLFSEVVLHGPGQQLLQAACDETSAASETLACTGGTN